MSIQLVASEFISVLGENWLLVLIGVLIVLVFGCLIGYFVGNTSLRSKVTAGIDGLEREKQIQKAVLDNVGIGIAVYDKTGAIFASALIPVWNASSLPLSATSKSAASGMSQKVEQKIAFGLSTGHAVTAYGR